MASVGQVYYDVLPNLDGFAAKVASGLGSQKPIKIPVEVDNAKAAASLKDVTGKTNGLTQSSARLAAAQGRVRVTAAQLNETRQKATAGSAKLVQAEERYATALRGVQKARADDARDLARNSAAKSKAAAATAAAAEREAAAQAKIAAAAKAARGQTIQKIGTGLLVAGAAGAAAIGGIVKVTADFDSAVSNVASTGKEASASIGRLREEAIKYGADTAFSATEAANAQAELIKANVSVTDTINGGLKGALDLAAAGSLGVADAAGIMGTTMSQFKLPGTEASHVADLLAAAAGKAQGEVQDFSEALKYVGPLAKSSGVSLEETTGVLAEFANQGILGSQAGTALRGIFLGLTAPVGAGAKAIEKYGINVRDASGNFIGLEGAAGELQKRLGGLTRAQRDAALAAIFGRNQVTAATILYEEGAKGVQQWSDAVNESGFAARTAATKMDNLAGDVEQLKGALDSAFIQSGGGGTSFLRGLAQDATEAIDSFNGLPRPVQEGAFQIAAVAGATLLATGGLIKVAGAGVGAISTLTTLGVVGPTAATGLTAVGAAGVAAGAGLAAVAAGNLALDALGSKSKSADELATSLQEIAQGGGDLNSVFSRSNFADQIQGALTTGIAPANDLKSAITGLEISQDTFLGKASMWREKLTPGTQSLQMAEKQVGALDSALSTMVSQGRGDQAAEALQRLGVTTEQQNRFLPKYAGLLNEAASATGAAASSFRSSEIDFKNGGAGMSSLGEAAGRTAEELATATQEMYAAASGSLALSGGAIAVEAAMDAAAAAAKKNGENLNISTDKGRDNQTALDLLVSKTNEQTKAMQDQQKPVADIAKLNDRAKKSYIDTAVAMGKNRDKATELANELFALPAEVTSQIVVSGAKVSVKQAESLNKALKTIPRDQRARIVTIANTKGAKEAQREIAKVKNKSVIAKATGKGVNTVKEIDAAIKKLKSKGVRAEAKAAGKPAVKALDDAIRALKNKRVQASASASGKGAVDSLRGSINSLRSKTVYVTVKRNSVGKGTSQSSTDARADGGPVRLPRRAGGGPVAGFGGPRQDNIAGVDMATGIQTSWVSANEYVTNARQYALNRSAVERINAGGKWDLIPRRADGGPVTASSGSGATRSNGRPLILNIDMGDLGVRRIVTEIVEDRDEYYASVGRMH